MTDKKIKILVTIDTESFFYKDRFLPFDVNIYGKIGTQEYGVGKIINLCDKFGIKALFFVDVYEHYLVGEKRLSNLCRFIDSYGHSVQLHAHPNCIPAHPHGFMKSYDLQSQSSIIAEGKSLIESWIGKTPVAFRAGAYGANLDTISALHDNEFLFDSSYFAYHPNCQLYHEISDSPVNQVFMINKIIELPVTVYHFKTLRMNKISKIDINACSWLELTQAFTKFINSDSPGIPKVIILFLHSFSFIKWNYTFTSFRPDHRSLKNFQSLLSWLVETHSDSVDFISLEDLLAYIGNRASKQLGDFIPELGIQYLIPRYCKRLISY